MAFTLNGKIKNVDYNATRGKGKGIEILADTKDGDRKYFMFSRHDNFANVKNVASQGGEVEIELVKNGKYWNLENLHPVSNSSGGNGNGNGGGNRNQNTEKRIARSVALKAATELVAATLTSKSDPTDAMLKVLQVAEDFMPYLELQPVQLNDSDPLGEEDPF